MNLKNEIIEITSTYFDEEIDYLKLSETTRAYSDILKSMVGKSLDSTDSRNDINFNNGKALGTFWAAECINDIIRTRQFIKGIDSAIKDAMKTKGSLNILYAGTGPYAALLLPSLLRNQDANINYTFLEINPISFEILKSIILKLDLSNWKIKTYMEDASTYKLDPKNPPDIIISETMQNALAKEQQVPIFLNLMSQCDSKTIFICI